MKKILIDSLQTCHQYLLDVLLCERGVGVFETFVDGDVVCHFVDLPKIRRVGV